MKSLKYLNKYFWKYKWRLVLGTLFIILSNWFGVVAPKVVRESIDFAEKVLKSNQQQETYQYTLFEYNLYAFDLNLSLANIFIFLGVLYLVVSIIKGVFLFFTRQTIIMMSRYIEFDLKNEIFNHYQNLSLAFYKRNNTGDLMNRISEDVSKVRMYLGPAVMYSINMLVLFVLVIYTMVSINPKLTFYVLVPLPILSISIYYVSNIINQKSEQVQRQLSVLSTFVQEAFSGIRVIKAYAQSEERSKKFEDECFTYRSKTLGLVKVNAVFMPLMMLLIGLSTILTIFIGGKLSIAGEVSTGNIAEFVIYVNMLTWPVAALGWVTSLTQRAAASQERLNEFLNTKPEISNPTNEPLEVKGNIIFKNVGFTYPDSGIEALKNFNLNIKQGESVAILGKTGSGKSTIANLICRLYDTTEGQILVDGKPIDLINLSKYRQAIGYVPQEDFLFSDSIKNNIAFGAETPATANYEDAAKKAEVYQNIMDFPDGFETKVGERGITLSGGQKQRVAMARAILRSPSILIFDDSLSAVDTETEDKIIENLKGIMTNKTTIIISHRVSSVKHCDKIVFLEDGKVAEQGSHEELITKEGLYFNLYQKQLLEEEKAIS